MKLGNEWRTLFNNSIKQGSQRELNKEIKAEFEERYQIDSTNDASQSADVPNYWVELKLNTLQRELWPTIALTFIAGVS